MGAITDAIATAFRDFVTAGIPASGPNHVWKSEARAIGPVIERMIGVGLGTVSVVKTTRTLLDADLAHGANTTALVYADATDANNDLYIKVGGSGSGGWTNTEALHTIMEGLGQPYVDLAQAAATAAANSAYRVSPMYPGITPHAAFDNLIAIEKIADGVVPDGKVVYFKQFYWAGGSFRGQMAYADDTSGTNEVIFADKLAVAAGYTGEQRIALRNGADTADVVELRAQFGGGSPWSSNMTSGGMPTNARIALLPIETAPLEAAEQEARALAIVNRFYREWANPTVTDRALLGLVTDFWMEQSDPGHDYVLRVGLDTHVSDGTPPFANGELVYRSRIHAYDPHPSIAAVVARCEISVGANTLTAESQTIQQYMAERYSFLPGAGAALGSPWPDVDYYGNAFGAWLDWTSATFNRPLPNTTDPAVAGVRRNRVLSRIEMSDRLRAHSEPRRMFTFGSPDADYESLSDLEVSLRLEFVGSYTLTDWPAHALSFTNQVLAEYAGTEPIEIDLNDLPIPRWMTVNGNGLVTFTGTASRILQQVRSSRLRGCPLVVTPVDEYAEHIDAEQALCIPGADGVLRHSETILVEDFIVESATTGHTVNLLGCGMSNGKWLGIKRLIVRRPAGSASTNSLILIHNNANTVVPGHVDIEDVILSKGGAGGVDILLQTLFAQPGPPHTISIRSSDVGEVAHEQGVGITDVAWQRRGKLSATAVDPDLNP
ncbi:hypothetical protein [Sphingomonas koreensis]